jgi:hypothetical protein
MLNIVALFDFMRLKLKEILLRNIVGQVGRPNMTRYSSVGRAEDCSSSGPRFDSGCLELFASLV